MRQFKAQIGKRRAERRRATTLAEVLVSIMILSIGLVSLATLFPISILRSLQASQLTNATILRKNAEAALDVNLEIALDPDSDGTVNSGQNYIVDPLGWNRNAGALQNTFGNNGVEGNEMPRNGLKRYSGLLSRFDATTIRMIDMSLSVEQAETIALRNALQAVTLPDSWVNVIDGDFNSLTPLSGAADRVTLPNTVNVSDLAIESPIISRIVLFDAERRVSHTRIITTTNTNLANRLIAWDNDLQQPDFLELTGNGRIPSGFQPGSFRIQTRDLRYTWLLTVRVNESRVGSIDVVVFFRRSFSPKDEAIHTATFVAGQRRVGISITGTEPFIKKGGFVFDVQNALWYRIQDIETVSGNPAYDLFLSVDRVADKSAGEDRNLNGELDTSPAPTEDVNDNMQLDFGQAIFMQGVVDVYRLDAKLFN